MSLSGTIGNSGKEKGRTKLFVLFVLALPIFPVRLQTSIFGRSELNFRVRNGNGWTLTVKNTNYEPSWHTTRVVHHQGLEPWTP